jgi:tripartite-type tricarboxylate transporter receptor subunit TctC
MTRITVAAACLIGAMIAAPLAGWAADAYPNKPIKLIVPFAAGGSSDVSARVFAKYAEQELKANIAVVNIAGAAGSIATREAAKAKPDGYTLLWHIPTIITAYHTGAQKFTWDSLTPIANVARFYKALVVHKDSPWKTMNDLLKDAKARPGQIKWGVNIGAGLHFEALGMEDVTGTKFRHVAGGGDADQVKAMLGKQIDVASPSDTVVLQYVADGTLRALGTSGEKRLPSLPNIPTYKEQGVDFTFWYDLILYGPPNMPADLVKTWSEVAKKVVANPAAVEDFRKLAMHPAWLNVEDTRELLLKTDVDLYRFARRGGLIPSAID